MTSRPSGVLVLIARDRLLVLSMVKYRASTWGCHAAGATGHVTDIDAFDLEDVGSVPGHHLGARRAGLNPGEVDHLDPSERQVSHDYFPTCG
jgi:hypothetical protein